MLKAVKCLVAILASLKGLREMHIESFFAFLTFCGLENISFMQTCQHVIHC